MWNFFDDFQAKMKSGSYSIFLIFYTKLWVENFINVRTLQPLKEKED